MARTNDAMHASVGGQNCCSRHPANLQHTSGNEFFSCLFRQANSLKELFNQIIEIQTQLKENCKIAGQKTIFSDVLMNEQLRPEEKTAPHLTVEAQTLVAAGTTTTAHILSILTYYVIRDPTILERLQSELGTVMSDAQPAPKWQQLDQLPFLVRSYHSHWF